MASQAHPPREAHRRAPLSIQLSKNTLTGRLLLAVGDCCPYKA